MVWSLLLAVFCSPWTLGLCAVVVALAWYKLHRCYSYFSDRNVPYMRPVPLFGNVAAVLFRRRTFMEQVRLEYRQLGHER